MAEQFARIPIALQEDMRLSTADLAVYASVAGWAGGRESVQVAVVEIARRAHTSPATARTCLKSLALAGWLSITEIPSQSSRYHPERTNSQEYRPLTDVRAGQQSRPSSPLTDDANPLTDDANPLTAESESAALEERNKKIQEHARRPEKANDDLFPPQTLKGSLFSDPQKPTVSETFPAAPGDRPPLRFEDIDHLTCSELQAGPKCHLAMQHMAEHPAGSFSRAYGRMVERDQLGVPGFGLYLVGGNWQIKSEPG